MIRAILFDLDGVLVETPDLHYVSLNRALYEAAGFEIKRDEHVARFNGLPTVTKLAMLISEGRLDERLVEQIWDNKQLHTMSVISEMIEQDAQKVELVAELSRRGYMLACVTNSITPSALLMLDRCGVLGYMNLVVTNQMIEKPKPDPECYLLAMRKLGLRPDESLIIEDAPKGIAAAEASGGRVLRVAGVNDVTLECILGELMKET